jgi:nucleotide-binding universal stress UspA family protein
VAQAISRVARELAAELIVVGMKGRSALSRFVLGDTTSAVLESAPCPVVVIPPALFEGRAE